MWNIKIESIMTEVTENVFVLPTVSRAALPVLSTRYGKPFGADFGVSAVADPTPADRRLSGATC
ncbi:hypothetical protein ACSDQ9_02750 [Aestuariimicrobium soli]|uniref:hypothetical protein n=1 Tax=Aestuariimicrobium soli TaxID=2035834 RepID=UPI003EBAA533